MIHDDFKESLELFFASTVRCPLRESPRRNRHKVEYLIVGGYAFAFHDTLPFTNNVVAS